MAEVGSAFVSILPSAKGFGSKLNSQVGGEVNSSGRTLGSRFGTVFKVGAAAAIGGAVVLGGFLKGSLDEAREAQKVGAQTNAVIKSTGGVANVTAGQVAKLASSISRKSGIDDEAIASASNMLLTFTNVRNETGKGNDIFNRATRTVTDMSVALGTDAKGSAIQLGKALNDPIAGISALSRAGVSFTEGQKATIKTLVESGQTIKAQKIILGELNKEFGGSAAAAATAGDKFKVAFGNLQESVGTALLPLFDKVLRGLTKFATFLTNNVGPGIVALNGYLAPAIASVGKFFSALGGSGQASGALSMFKSIGQAIATNFLPVLRAAASTFTTYVLPAAIAVGSYFVSKLVPIFQQVVGVVKQVIPVIASLATYFYTTLYPAVLGIVAAIASKLKPVFDQLFATIQNTVLPVISDLIAKFQEWLPDIKLIISAVVKVAGFLLIMAATILGKVLPPVVRLAAFLISHLYPAVAAVIGVVIKIIAGLIRFVGALVSVGAKVIGFAARVRAGFEAVKAITATVFTAVRTIIVSAFAAVRQAVSAGVAQVKAVITRGWNIIKSVTTFAWNAIKFSVLHPFSGTAPGVGAVAAKLDSLLAAAWESIKAKTAEAWEAVKTSVVDKIAAVVGVVQSLPGRISAALGNLGSLLYSAGAELIQGLVNGILSKISAITDAMGSIGSKIKGFLPGSPVKEGPLKSWNNGGAGKRLVGLLADGLGDIGTVDAAMQRLASRVALSGPSLSVPVAAGAAAGAGSAGGRVALTITNWQAGTGYFEQVADGRVASDGALKSERARAYR